MHHHWLSVYVALLLPCVACPSQPPTKLDTELGRDIDKMFADIEDDAPGAAAMVIREGVVVHASGYGMADRGRKLPFTRKTPVRLASVTKQFTCMAILKLAEQGKLSIDDPAVKFLPVLSRLGESITIRHLMQHTSGLPDYYSELRRRQDNPPSGDENPLFTGIDAAKLYETWGEMQAPVGEDYSYSNPGYELLALIIEQTSGLTFNDYMRRNLFEPAGMPTAVVRDRPELIIPERAIGYARTRTGGYRENDDHPLNWMVGSGCLYASLDDLYYWDQALQHNRMVTAGSKAAAFTTTKLNNGKSTKYGFGWRIDKHLGRRRVSHGGSWVGFRTHISRYPDDHVAIVVLSNLMQFKPGEFASSIAKRVFGSDTPKPAPKIGKELLAQHRQREASRRRNDRSPAEWSITQTVLRNRRAALVSRSGRMTTLSSRTNSHPNRLP